MVSDQLQEDETTIKEAQRRNKQAFRRLVYLYSGYIRAVLLHNGAREEDGSWNIEDIVQKTWLRVWKNLKGYAGQSTFSTWLTRIALNQLYDTWRRKVRSDSFSFVDDSGDVYFSKLVDTRHPGEGFIENDFLEKRLSWLRLALNHLSEDQRQVIRLSLKFKGDAWVAKQLHCPVNTVRSRRLLAMKKLTRMAKTRKSFIE